MSRTHRKRTVQTLVIGVLIAGIAVQAYRVVSHLREAAPLFHSRYVRASVTGNVARPGTYRIPEGTSQFELLQVAGVRPTSDLGQLFLFRQVAAGEKVKVGTLDAPVSVSTGNGAARLEFFFGEVNIISHDGRDKPQQEGTSIDKGDRIQTEAKSQVEVSLGGFSRVDIDAFSDVTFDNVGQTRNGKTVTELYQQEGSAWYQFVLSSKEEVYTVSTERVVATVSGAGADFMVEVGPEATSIHVFDGLLLVDRPKGGESVNLIAGQSLVAYSDSRPFQVARTAEDVSAQDKFNQLTEEKNQYMTNRMPLNFLFLGIPTAYYMVNVLFDEGTVQVIHLPSRTSVVQFAQGFTTLSEAYLHGGAMMVTTLAEQILNARIPYYVVVKRDGLAKVASLLGDVTVNVDDQAASRMGTKGGKTKLGGEQLSKFLSPGLVGVEDRQVQVLKALFEAFRSRNLVLTALSADQIVANIETNFTGAEIMKQYGKFTMRGSWKFLEHRLPTVTMTKNGKSYEEPDLEKARAILFREE